MDLGNTQRDALNNNFRSASVITGALLIAACGGGGGAGTCSCAPAGSGAISFTEPDSCAYTNTDPRTSTHG